MFIKKLLLNSLIGLSVILLTPGLSLAKKINLYSSPSDTAKVSGQIDLSGGIIPIYQPKNSKWIKVANPNNGDTGWIRENDMTDSNGNKVTFQQKYYQSDNGSTFQSMQMVDYGKPLTAKEKEQLNKEAIDREKALQKSLMESQQTMGKMLNEMQKAYDQSFDAMEKAGMPAFRNYMQPPKQPTSNTPKQ